MFIVLEGPDCAGKTTQAERLASRLRACVGCDVLKLAFPSKSPAGIVARACVNGAVSVKGTELPRGCESTLDPVVRQSLMLADQYSQVGQIQDCLRRGGIVVADRWTPSGQVYGTLEGLDRNWILDAQNSLPIADVHFLLDVDVDVICARLASRGSTRGIYEVEAFQQRVVSLYRTIWSTNAQGSGKRWTRNMWRRVDATRDEPIIHEELFAIVSRMNWNG